MSDDKPASRGRFWGALIAQILAVVVMGGGAGLGVSSAQAADVDDVTSDQAAMQEYIDDELLPALGEQLDAELDALAEEFEFALSRCLDKAERADRQSFAALEGMRMRFGARSVERALGAADDALEDEDEGPPAPAITRRPHAREPLRGFADYQQQLAGE